MSKLKYLTNDIDELEAAEHDLEVNGVPRSHIHILSENDTALVEHDLPGYSEWSKRDIFYFGSRGAMIGLALSSIALIGGYLYGVSDPTTWIVLTFISAMVVGFCSWEGGLIGVNKLNHAFSKYAVALKNGAYLLVIDTTSEQEEKVARYSIESHPRLRVVD